MDDDPNSKYIWVSSNNRDNGCPAECYCHFVGVPSKYVIITEGALKADIINAVSGHPVLAVPGVNALSKVQPMLEELMASGLKKVYIAYDMDYLTNPNVQQGKQNLLNILYEMGLKYTTLVWNPDYKGMDDYLTRKMR